MNDETELSPNFDLPLSSEDEALIESRLAAHRADPKSSIPLEELKRRLRAK